MFVPRLFVFAVKISHPRAVVGDVDGLEVVGAVDGAAVGGDAVVGDAVVGDAVVGFFVHVGASVGP